MPQIMVEAFARGLVDKIMLEAFDVLDTDSEDGKIQMNCHAESVNIESQPTNTRLQMHDHAYSIDCNGAETRELIEKMVCGLRDIQIGDSSCVLPPPLSKLEKQVKRVARNIGSASLGDSIEADETRITHGQGDVHQIMHDAIIETPAVPTEQTATRMEKEHHGANEATRISVSLLHRMIEELEMETGESASKHDPDPNSANKDGIAAWEEHEEQFIRAIEGEEDQNNPESHLDDETTNSARNVEYKGLKSSSPINSPSCSRHIRLEDVAIEEIEPSPLPNPKTTISADNIVSVPDHEASSRSTDLKTKKKRSLAARMRKFLRCAFGRGKN